MYRYTFGPRCSFSFHSIIVILMFFVCSSFFVLCSSCCLLVCFVVLSFIFVFRPPPNTHTYTQVHKYCFFVCLSILLVILDIFLKQNPSTLWQVINMLLSVSLYSLNKFNWWVVRVGCGTVSGSRGVVSCGGGVVWRVRGWVVMPLLLFGWWCFPVLFRVGRAGLPSLLGWYCSSPLSVWWCRSFLLRRILNLTNATA